MVGLLRQKLIDIHTHLHPPRLFAAIRRWFAERSTWKLEEPTEPARVAATLRAHGVERFVFCSYAHRPGMARSLNAWLTQTARELGGYGIPLATVHPDDPEYLADLEIALRDGCAGLKLHEDVQRLHIDDPRMRPVLERLESRFVLVHVGHVPWHNDAGDPERVATVLQRHPKLRIVVAHMGVQNTRAYLAMMDRYPNLYLDTTMAFAHPSPMRIEIAGEEIEAHAHRIVYGTDYPNAPYPYPAEAEAISALGLSGSARDKILRENAAQLLGLTASRPAS